MKPVHVAEKLLLIAKKYPLQNGKETLYAEEDIPVITSEPDIIISESFH